MWNPFAFIKNRIRGAVIEGFAEGLDAVGVMDEQSSVPAVQRLAMALAQQKPPLSIEYTEPEEPKSKKKGS